MFLVDGFDTYSSNWNCSAQNYSLLSKLFLISDVSVLTPVDTELGGVCDGASNSPAPESQASLGKFHKMQPQDIKFGDMTERGQESWRLEKFLNASGMISFSKVL